MHRRPKTLVNKGGRECTRCLKYKKWSEFASHKNNATGHASICKICMREYVRNVRAKGGAWGSPAKPNSDKDIDLGPILLLRRTSKNDWLLKEVEKFYIGLLNDFGTKDLKSIYKKYAPDKKVSSCDSLRKELIRAAKAGMKLRAYWRNRKFSAYAKYKERMDEVIEPGKKRA